MPARLRLLALSSLFFLAAAALPTGRPAVGDAVSDKAEKQAVLKGQALYRKVWRRGAKSCAACHTRGPNVLTAARLKAYPRYDTALGKVITGQQKLNEMIKTKALGRVLPLGGDDLNALEAYISALK